MNKIKKAKIPAARFRYKVSERYKSLPIEMLQIVDKPTIQFILEELVNSVIEDIIIVTGNGKRAIVDHFDNAFELEQSLFEKVQKSSLANIHFIPQQELKCLGHTIWCASSYIAYEPFEVLLGDDIVESETTCIKQLIKNYHLLPVFRMLNVKKLTGMVLLILFKGRSLFSSLKLS